MLDVDLQIVVFDLDVHIQPVGTQILYLHIGIWDLDTHILVFLIQTLPPRLTSKRVRVNIFSGFSCETPCEYLAENQCEY